MAGQGRNRGTRAHGRSARVAPSWPVLAAASAAVSGSIASPSRTLVPKTRPASAIATRSTYRSLLIKGLEPNEAANLTAFLCGIAVVPQPWKLTEVNRLLFLRELARRGHFGETDGTEKPFH